ncbi:hypothetical protein NIA70_20285, partial [[Clostridium] scindens]|uniref:DapH/DapD/GlmU-related protein n=1 Tax=Clostridium scindens (strain JCM 10418 / VPI 12708) TaxID=29347 RepID=UPI0025B74D6A
FVDLGKDVTLGKNCNIQAHVTISNGCVLGDDVFIAPNSSLLNDKYPKKGVGIVEGKNVQIGKDVSIWNYVVIGDRTKIGDGTLIGSFVDLGKDVTLGKNCNIQAHVTISNGCVLGDDVFIAPNSSLLN